MKKHKVTIVAVMFWCVLAVSSAAWCGDNGNGTVALGNLVVLQDAGCLGRMTWDSAMARANALADGQCGLSDNSKIGDWRLPTIEELQAIYFLRGQFKNVRPNYYWSSTTYGGLPTFAWRVLMPYGKVSYGNKDNVGYVWPVRGGQ